DASNEATLILNSPLLGELKLPKGSILTQEKFALATPQQAQAESISQVKGEDAIRYSEEEMALLSESSLMDKLVNFNFPDSWNGNVRFGLDLSTGDSKWRQLYSKGSLVIDPLNSPNYYRFAGSYTYRTTDRTSTRQVLQGEETVTETFTETVKLTDRFDGNFTYRRDMSGPFFLQNSLGGRVDQVKGINYEIQELVGVGIRFEPTERMELIVGGGGGIEEFNPDFEDTRSGLNPVTNVFQEFTWRIFDKATFAQEFNYFVNPEQNEQYNYVFSAAFRYRLTELLGLEISYDKNYDNDVGNGNLRDDTRWRNAIILYF
ncbi:MAG: DUF481 domain-containing protein, partial [Opitutales bacterium]